MKRGSRCVQASLLALGFVALSDGFSMASKLPTSRRTFEPFAALRAGTEGGGKRKQITIKELQEKMLKSPSKYSAMGTEPSRKKKATRRTRRRVESPKQQYLYASQRSAKQQAVAPAKKDIGKEEGENENENETVFTVDTRNPLLQAKEFGMVPATQHCDPLVDGLKPRLVGQIRISEEAGSGSFAYLVEKPAGWSILGSQASKSKKTTAKGTVTHTEESMPAVQEQRRRKTKTQVKLVDEDGNIDILEYSEEDILALLTPEELEEMKEDLGTDFQAPARSKRLAADLIMPPKDDDPDSSVRSHIKDEHRDLDEETLSNLRRIEGRKQRASEIATFAEAARPSVITWLKDVKAGEGVPIRGGNFWTAIAGACEVDDSGLVLLCPKANTESIFVEYAEYVTVVGNGGHLVPRSKVNRNAASSSNDVIKFEIVSKVRKGRGDDAIQTVRVLIPDKTSTCSSIVELCQKQFQDGIRGDPAGNPFDRRARRRLIHCESMSVSSLVFDETCEVETDMFPDDIAVLADRRNHLEYTTGSFLGRASLQQNEMTNAYREVNGAADGFPGWTVDRYDKWLLVQHDPKEPRGPLPSIHDGNTLGIYYIESSPDRSSMGASTNARARLLEGKPAPEFFPIVENGVKYVVNLDRDLSTGIFLDQRPQRAWLSRNCCVDTQLLNCFAHTGAFSVAAASTGASTVSIDLSKKWLDRLSTHLEANDIEFDERHDAIYGDCFDWLSRLAKRGEKYDIVILDPPSSSVGGRKKKRWSIKNDMDELVALAANLVKKGGLLWTTTNSASTHPIKFARLCQKGLDDAGIENAKLERIQPMPADFQTIGPQPVTNLVWRIP
jgi:23S rRNA (cytosine1962-C5)-methyltransferase